MDEKIFERIIPIVVVIAVLVIQYAIRNQKKKNAALEPIPENEEFEPIPEHDFGFPKKEKSIIKNERTEPEVLQTENNNQRTGVKKSQFHKIKQNMKPNMKQNIKSSFNSVEVEELTISESITFTDVEIRKAIIYSEIITPKHF